MDKTTEAAMILLNGGWSFEEVAQLFGYVEEQPQVCGWFVIGPRDYVQQFVEGV